MEYALPSAWDQGSRGFWTRRRKSATSLMAVIALLAGIAVAYKLFDRTIPNNVVRDASKFDFEIHVLRSPAICTNTVPNSPGWCQASGIDPIYRAGVDQFPGDTRTETIRIRNTNTQPPKDASFEMWVDQTSIVVRGCDNLNSETGICGSTPLIGVTDSRWNTFVQYWRLTVSKELILDTVLFGEVPETKYQSNRYAQACQGGLKELTQKSPCKLGMIREAGAENDLGDRLDERKYQFAMNEQDTGTDQSAFKGWTITFSMAFNARVPAEEEAGTGLER